MKLPVRQPVAGGSVRQPQPIALTALARVLGFAFIVGAGAGLYWLTTSPQFALDPQKVLIGGLANTAPTEVQERIGLQPDSRPNVFRLSPTAMADSIRSLASVESVEVAVSLPDRLDIEIVERQPLLIWRTAVAAFYVDASGVLLAQSMAASGLPMVYDGRAGSEQLTLGRRLDAVDMAAARLLLTITPADVGSRATTLALSVADEDGFVLSADYPNWRAVFGFYTANQMRPDERVPRQRQCLSSILAGGEDRIQVVYLAIAGDTCGTYRDRPTPSARFFQNVARIGA